MEMSLRKAAQLRTALTKRLAQIVLQPQVAVSVYEADLETPVLQARVELLEQMAIARRLEDILFNVRAAIGRANAESGIDDLLARKAKLGIREVRLAQLAARSPARLDIARAKLDTMKARVAAPDVTRYSTEETLLVEVLEESNLAEIQAELAAIRREQMEIGDQLLTRNVATKVTILDEDVVWLELPGIAVL